MKRIGVVAMLVLALSLLAGCGGNKASEPMETTTGTASEKKIAFVTGTGGLGDKSFNDLGYQGVLKLKEEGIQVDVAEPKAISEMEGLIRNFADTEEYALIVTMGGDSVDSVKAVSEDYSNQPFLIMDGFAGSDNIKSVLLSQVDTSFLVGAYAALMEQGGHLPKSPKANKIGIVGGMDIPIIRSVVAGYTAGAKFIDPKIEVLTAFVGAWNDPGKGTELAQSLYEQGAGVIFHAAGGSGMGVLEAAKKLDRYAIGYDGNQNSIAPDNIPASGARGTADMVYTTAKEALEGKYKGGDFAVAMKDNPATSQLLMEETNVKTPQDVLDKLEKIKTFLIEAKVAIPSDPAEVDAYIQQVGTFQ